MAKRPAQRGATELFVIPLRTASVGEIKPRFLSRSGPFDGIESNASPLSMDLVGHSAPAPAPVAVAEPVSRPEPSLTIPLRQSSTAFADISCRR